MNTFTPISRLNGRALLFPFALVLFEFSTYIAHDMVQPGMLAVTHEYGVGPEWVATALAIFLVGGMSLQWILGPLSDKYGRRPVFLTGVMCFVLACALTNWAQNIEQFILLRYLQGFSICFVGAVGYAAIQEAFNESLSVRIMALMANVSLIAPLLGPLVGAAWLSVFEWRGMFLLFAGISLVSFVLLLRFMPETAGDRYASISLPKIARVYKRLVCDRQVRNGSLCIGLVFIPILSWVALSPVILMHEEGLSRLQYSLLQVPVFLCMIAGNITLSAVAGKVSLDRPVRFAIWPILAGLTVALVAMLVDTHAYLWLTAGLSCYAFGAGMVNAGLYRMTLYSSQEGKGSVAAMLGMITMLTLASGLELSKHGYFAGGTPVFALINFVAGVCWFALVRAFLRERRSREILAG